MIDAEKIRSDFPALSQKVYGKPLVYLDNAATTHKPKAVLEKILEYYTTMNSNIHRGVHYLSEKAGSAYADARQTVKEFIHAASLNEIIFTGGTTGSINLLADAFGRTFVGEGDEIIITEMEHHSNIIPWQVLAKRKNAVLRFIPLNKENRLSIDTLSELINDNTKLISLCHVSDALGVINPVHEVIRQAHERGIPVLIDAAQSVPHFPVDVQKLDCDFLAFSGHKLYAETGIGILYAKEKYLKKMSPYQTGGGMISRVSLDETVYAELPYKFEAGTPNIAGAISLAAAIDYVNRTGMEKIALHEAEIYDYMFTQLRQIEGLTIYAGTGPNCGGLSFNLEGIHPSDAAMVFDKMGIAVRSGTHCADPVMDHLKVSGTIRASIALYTTRKEIDILVKGIKKVQDLFR
ncbi:MAG: cysteine desulfurase [Candidatus Marinimicrobia bacterium]|nr:cysteine desulfurase [Candidatus Neomarinimicrobiota bacterium]